MSGENVVQSACMDSLAIYFREKGVRYRQLWTYSNQQGKSANKFCGDLVGVIDNASMFALEMKALDHASGELSKFDDDQYDEAVEMEENGIPIFYCYDECSPLAYYVEPQPATWPVDTLKGLNVSSPKGLDCKTPKRASHMSLFHWLEQQAKGGAASPLERFAELVGQVLPNKMRNGLVTVLFSKKHKEALALDQNSLQVFYNYLVQNPGAPGSEAERRIQSLLAGISIGKSRAQSRLHTTSSNRGPKI